MKMIVNIKTKQYPIYLEQGALNKADSYISEVFRGKKVMIISDETVFSLYGGALVTQLSNSYEVHSFAMKPGEASKRFDTLQSIYQALIQAKISRSDLIIALGGGVVGDITGFVAATYLRGISYVQIPTSLLAQVDSSVGGKVAVDLPEGKNLVGAFYHPDLVIIDPLTLNTLPKRYLNDGMGEVIKYGCIKDLKLFEQLESCKDYEELMSNIDEVIYRCIDCKRQVVEADEFDHGERMLLNFGHTIGHAIEQYYNYEKYSHGEAVSIGMYQLTKISESLNLTKKDTSERIKGILLKYQLPIECGVSSDLLVRAVSLDKKNIEESLSYVILEEIGISFLYKANPALILNNPII